jgi:hypothetical protein
VFVNSVVLQFATATGFLAAAIAVGGFLAHARPAIAGEVDSVLRRRTAIGGLLGFAVAVSVIGGSMAVANGIV